MAIHSPQNKLTYDDFVRIPEDHLRHEILDGVHVVSPAPSRKHQNAAGRLYQKLLTYLDEHPHGEVYAAPFDVRLSSHDIVEPDLLFVSKARLELVTDSYVLGVPELVIEVVSPSNRRRDLGLKRERYETLGVEEYWVLDADRCTATVFRRQDGRFIPTNLSVESADLLTTPLIPGLELPLAEIFREQAARPTTGS